MKSVYTSILGVLLCASLTAATPAYEPVPLLPITGTMQINYGTRSSTKENATDLYQLNINVANSVQFSGTIIYLPFIHNNMSKNRPGSVTYEMNLDVINPANPKETKNVGKIFGSAPIDEKNIYHYDEGLGIRVAVNPIGQAKGFESRFNGTAAGKPFGSTGITRMKQEAVKLVSSKGGSIIIKDYDKMTMGSHVLPSGPVQVYPETTVVGTLFYDYARMAWHFNNVTFSYLADPVAGRRAVDTLTGSIRWVEDPGHKTNGLGHYEFDIRVNEPPPSESAVFAAVADEAAFFATDETSPMLVGTMNYKDVIKDGITMSSNIQVDLKAKKLSRQQAMMLAKLIFFTAVVPVNAD